MGNFIWEIYLSLLLLLTFLIRKVLVKFDYKIKTFYEPVNRTITIEHTFNCGGTLINRDTVITAGHCIPHVIEFEYKNKTYPAYVELNELRPTWGSMFTVYLGMHDISSIVYENLKGGIKMNVEKVIRVEFFLYFFFESIVLSKWII